MKTQANFRGKPAAEMQADISLIRGGSEGTRLGRSITFGAYCRDVLGAPVNKVLYDLGVDLSSMTVQALITVDKGIDWLYPEMVLEAIYEGFVVDQWETDLITQDIPVRSKTIKAPKFELNQDAGPHETQEGETIRLTFLNKGDRTVEIRKIAEAIGLTYEASMFSTVAEVGVWMKQFGINMSSTRKAYLVDRLVNGDQADASMAPAVIGIGSVADGFVWKDFLRVCARMAKLGFPIAAVVCDEDEYLELATIEEFSKLQRGQPLSRLVQKTPVPAHLNQYLHSGVGAGKLLFVCPASAAYQGTAIPFKVETKREITNQTDIAAASITADIINLMRPARVIVDTSLAFADHGWPTWMTPPA